MKKRLFCYLFAACCAAVVLPSCSDDDAPDYTQVIDSDFAGEYKGELDIKIDGTLFGSDVPQNITVTKASASAVTLSLKDFSFAGIHIGDIEMKDCQLTADGDDYTFASEQELKVPGLTCTIHAVGTLAKGGKVLLKMDIDALLGEVNQKVEVVYEGSRLKGDENTEAKMLTFTFDTANEKNACVIEQPVMGEDNVITFRVNEEMVTANPDLLKSLEPTITFSEDASVSSTLDGDGFSKDVTYTVLSEDGKTKATYTVKKPFQALVSKYSFEEDWVSVSVGDVDPYKRPQPVDIWDTSNEGAKFGNLFPPYIGYPVTEELNGFTGKAVKLETLDGRNNMMTQTLAPIVPGSLFTGKFDGSNIFGNPLTFTHFGVDYTKKPLTFSGAYKYQSGELYLNGKDDKVGTKDIADKGSIVAVLYEVTGEDFHLDGTTINDKSLHVMSAVIAEDGLADTKGEWVSFKIDFKLSEGKTYDPSKTYKLAIVCSSSKDGDKFKGALGSTLWVDELEVIGE